MEADLGGGACLDLSGTDNTAITKKLLTAFRMTEKLVTKMVRRITSGLLLCQRAIELME